MPLTPRAAVSALSALTLLLIPASASASGSARYAAVAGEGSTCSVALPCSLSTAVAGASSGDEVVVAPGTYAVDTSVSPLVRLDIHGMVGQPRPWLVGTSTLAGAVVSAKQGGTLRHLGLKATAADGDALTLQRGTGEDLLLVSMQEGDGGKLVGSANGTVLRDSVVHASGGGDSVAGLKLRTSAEAGDVHLVNVTVEAPAATGIRCDITGGQATLVNTIVHGGDLDVDTSHAPAGRCTASTSNFRAASAAGLVSGLGNQETAPRFVDPARADYRVLGGSPTDDAGALDAFLGTADPAGCARTLGLAPDIGAYEHVDPVADACASTAAEPLLDTPALPQDAGGATPGTQDDQGEDEDGDGTPDLGKPAPNPAPELGKSLHVEPPAKGKLRVKVPGSKRFRPIVAATHIPVGSVIDARDGRVRLTSALDAAGRIQSATFWGSKFLVRQSEGARGRVDLFLRGTELAGCHAATSTPGTATAAAARKRPRRSLWGKDRHGRYRTHGQSSAATARGTRWVTSDTCAGTRTRVVEGAVAVRDFVRHRTVIVRAGHSLFVRKKQR
jgi:hypothetical protein